MSPPADKLLEHVPATMPGVSVNTLACRCDMSHHAVRRRLAQLEAGGSITHHSVGGTVRYYREPEATMNDPHSEPRTGERVILALPKTEAEAITIAQLAELLAISPASANSALVPYRGRGDVLRVGAGGRSDPYRYYIDLPFELDGDGYAGPIAPPDELPDGYTDAPEVAAAKMRAEAAGGPGAAEGSDAETPARAEENGENEAVESPVAADRPAADTVGPPYAEPVPITIDERPGDELRRAYRRVAQDLRLRARDARHESAVLDAGAQLLGRLADELAP